MLLFLITALGIGGYIWKNSFEQIDILRRKNDTASLLLTRQLESSNNIEFIREQAINSIKHNKSER